MENRGEQEKAISLLLCREALREQRIREGIRPRAQAVQESNRTICSLTNIRAKFADDFCGERSLQRKGDVGGWRGRKRRYRFFEACIRGSCDLDRIIHGLKREVAQFVEVELRPLLKDLQQLKGRTEALEKYRVDLQRQANSLRESRDATAIEECQLARWSNHE